MGSEVKLSSDAVVIGGGLAGLASAIHLRRAGFSVICLEPVEKFTHIVGESLDWSAPELFNALGFSMEDLVRSGIATYKRHVILQLKDGSRAEYVPSEWLSKPPFNVELKTLHLDRVRLHESLQALAESSGVEFIREAAAGIEHTGKTVCAVTTNEGKRYTARWFVDASGSSASFLGRKLNLTYDEYGERKVGIWSYATAKDWREGTTLYSASRRGEYFSWIWEIPVAPETLSLGFITTGAYVKEQRAKGLTVDEILRRQLSKFQRFDRILAAGELPAPTVRSFQSRVCRTACGPNWIITGEAAAVPDPITGNGVTGALRHAEEGSRLIIRNRRRLHIPWYSRTLHNLRLRHMGRFFNSLIERLAYGPALRDRYGLLKTGDIYTAFAWSMNHLYSRLRPRGLFGTLAFCGSLTLFRCGAWLAEQIVRALPAPNALLTREAS